MAGILMTDPGFGRGATLGVSSVDQGGSVTGTQKTFTDTDPRTNNAGKHLSNRPVTCVALRNATGGTVQGGTVVSFLATDLLNSFGAAAADHTGMIGVVDEYLPASGVKANDVCWVVVSGPTAAATSGTFAAGDALSVLAGEATASLAAGDIVGYALSPESGGKVRAVVGTPSEHSIG
jgi:hypothetical protein